MFVNQGRVVEEQMLLGLGGSAFLDQLEIPTSQALCQLPGVPDRRRRTDESRRAPIEPANAIEPSQQVRNVTSEDAAIRM